MSEIGYYRYKTIASVNQTVTLFVNDAARATKHIIVKDWCSGNKRLKFLNKDGQYRFLAFNRYFEGKDNVKELGKTNKIVTSLLNSQTSQNSIGNKNERILSLRADDISEGELLILNDLWASPRIFLYVGDGTTDLESDWVQVGIKSKNSILNIRKGSYTSILLDVILPEHYTINMI